MANSETDFWRLVDSSDGLGCWPWTRPCSPYGRFRLNGKYISAHRIALLGADRAVTEKLLVCHRCDNPKCCRPSHLFLGTYQDNRSDAVAKGRHAYGERSGVTNLQTSTVAEIKSALRAGSRISDISRRFNIPDATIDNIKAGRAWAHVGDI
jgi:hypothetical protein